MILNELVKWWEGQPDGLPPGYQPAFLTKKIVLDADGRFRGLLPVGTEKRGTRTGLSYAPGVPRVKRSGTGAKPSLIADNSVYTLGLVREKDKPADVAAKHGAFVALVRECAAATDDPGVLAVATFLASDKVGELRADSTLQPDDDLVFEIEGRFVTDAPSVKEFWASRQAPSEDATLGTCLVTGVETTIAARHPYKIKGVPGGQAQGTDLISINNPSGESYGLKAALNSPVGTVAAEAICNGLNRLLAEKKHHLTLGETAYVWWMREGDGFDLGDFLNSPSPEAVGELLRTTQEGGESEEPQDADFFVLALSNNVSRTVVRDEFATTLVGIKQRLIRWFVRLELAGLDGPRIRPPGVYRIAVSLYRDKDDMPKRTPVSLLGAALRGAAPPRELLELAVRRNRTESGPYSTYKKVRSLSTARLALTRAVLHDRYPELTPMLNPDLNQPAYQCGRLLSVLESIQRVAIPNLNATLTDKHYSAAAATPALVFGVLLKDAASAHLPKLRKNRSGAYVALDAKLQDVLGRLTEFPRTLDYEAQGLFSLGYYHQKAADIAAAKASRELREIADAPNGSDQESED